MDAKPIIYIVDDEPGIRKVLQLTAEMMGLDVACFGSTREFLDAYDASGVACLVVDLRMPETTGLQVFEMLRELDRRLPTIVISGHATLRQAVDAMKCGAIDFLEKPYAIPVMRESILRALAKSRAERQQANACLNVRARFDALTSDERQVAEFTIVGETDKRIATRLDVSTRTVQLRRARALKKMQASSKSELARMMHSIQKPPSKLVYSPDGV
jgi:FixJ family two-component response regulator